MGAVSFSLDGELVRTLKAVLPLEIFVETGTFHGDTVANLRSLFQEIISVELSEELAKNAAARFSEDSHVQIYQGESSTLLRKLNTQLNAASALYWLDAHWCVAENTAGSESQCPLLDELKSLDKLNDKSVILIDDARLFLAPPPKPHQVTQWPMFDEIVRMLLKLSSNHEVMVVNDVIAFYPKSVRDAVIQYAHNKGVDWLDIIHQSSQRQEMLEKKELGYQELLIALDKKESEYHNLMKKLEESERLLSGLDSINLKMDSIEKHNALQLDLLTKLTYKSPVHHFPIRHLRSLVSYPLRRVKQILTPRLGNLNQYAAPIPIQLAEAQPKKLSHHPKVSIVTPSFGQANFIERTIQSVLTQDYPNLEYFVQDGGSDDGTTDILEEYESELADWTSELDSGQSQAINRGFSQSSGDIMAWLNSDDLLLPGAINTVIDFFNKNPEVDVVYGDRLMVDEEDREIGRWILPGHDSKALEWADFIPQETMFWRRRIWEMSGGQIDESFRFAMDWDLLTRFKDAGARFAHISSFLGAFRIHEQQKTSSVIHELGMEEMDRIRERIHGYTPDTNEVRRKVAPFLIKHIIKDLGYRIKTRLGHKSKLS